MNKSEILNKIAICYCIAGGVALSFSMNGCDEAKIRRLETQVDPGVSKDNAGQASTVADASTSSDDASVPVVGACEAGGALCSASTVCCDALFCSEGLTEPAVCRSPLALGESCNEDPQCASGHCRAWICRESSCGGEEDFCYGAQAPCCEGLFCDLDPNSYGQGACRAQRADGENCLDASECATGLCTEGVCGDPNACHGEGGFCYPPHATCCAEFFCSLDSNAYGVGSCMARLATGEVCQQDGQCSSGHCVDEVCVY